MSQQETHPLEKIVKPAHFKIKRSRKVRVDRPGGNVIRGAAGAAAVTAQTSRGIAPLNKAKLNRS